MTTPRKAPVAIYSGNINYTLVSSCVYQSELCLVNNLLITVFYSTTWVDYPSPPPPTPHSQCDRAVSQDSTCRYPYITTAATKTAYTHRDQETKRPTDQSAILRPIGIQLAESIGRGWQSTTTTTLQQQYFFLSLTVTSESIHPSSHYYYYFCYCTLLQFWSDDDKLTAVQSTFDPIEELYNFSINTGWERGNGEKEFKKSTDYHRHVVVHSELFGSIK